MLGIADVFSSSLPLAFFSVARFNVIDDGQVWICLMAFILLLLAAGLCIFSQVVWVNNYNYRYHR